MTTEMEIAQMKKTSPLTKWGGIAGALVAIIGLISQVGPPLLDWVLSERDARIEKVQAELSMCGDKVKVLEELADSAIDASEKKFQHTEIHAVELRGALESLRNEVSIRHGGNTSAAALPPTHRRRSRSQVIHELEEQSDAHLKHARVNAPRPTSLRKMIERKEKPEAMPAFD